MGRTPGDRKKMRVKKRKVENISSSFEFWRSVIFCPFLRPVAGIRCCIVPGTNNAIR